MQSLKFCTYEGTIDFFDASNPAGDVSSDHLHAKVGDTLTAIVLGGAGTYKYSWTLNGNTVGYAATFTIPTTSKEGDVIAVTVTDEEGNTATDSVIVGATTELALESVEGAARNAINDTYNVVIAYFNQPIDGLVSGDVQIRRVSDDQLFAIDSVSLSSDGMKATITLANSNAAGAQVEGLLSNVDYNMIVTSEDGTASKIFSIPATLSNVFVSGFDADKGSISVGSGNDHRNGAFTWAAPAATLTVPADMTVDYNDLLGRTVTVKYDKKMNLTSLVVDPDETVIYGAFKGSADNKNLTEVVSEATFKAQDNAAGTIDPSAVIAKTPQGWDPTPVALTTTTLTSNTLAYTWGKLVLNPNNTIKVLVSDNRKWDTYMLVTDVIDNTILAGTSEQNLKDYTILEGGLTIGIEDIEEGDLVFVDRTNKFAVVYNNAETGELEAVYDGKFTFGGETYDVSHTETATKLNSDVYYNKDGGERTQVDNDYLNALVAGGEDVTVYFGLNGQPAYLTGEVGETVTTTESLVLTAASKFYTEKLSDYLRVKGFNGEEVKTYDIDLSKLEFIVESNGTTNKKGYVPYTKGNANPVKNSTYKGFKVGTVAIDTAGAGSIIQDGGAAGVNLLTNATLGKKAFITLTKNDKDQVIGINFEDLNATSDGQANNQLRDNVDFKSGLKTVNGYQISGSTPVYVYKVADPNKDTVEKFTLDDFTSVVPKANNNKVHVYSSNDKDVSSVVIESDGLAGDTTGQTTQEVVVKSSKRDTSSNTSADTKLTELTVIYQGEETTYTKFASAVAGAASPAAGDIYTMVINKNGETIDSLDRVGDLARATVTVTSVDKQEFTFDGGATKLKLASTVEPTIVKFEGGAFVPGTFADVVDADTTTTTPKQINYSMLSGSANYVDTIVVTGNDNAATTAAIAAAKAAAEAAIEAADAKWQLLPDATKQGQFEAAVITADAAVTEYTSYGQAATSLTPSGAATFTTYTAYNTNKTKYNAAKTGLNGKVAADVQAAAQDLAAGKTIADAKTAIQAAVLTNVQGLVPSATVAASNLTFSDWVVGAAAPVDTTPLTTTATNLGYKVVISLDGYTLSVPGCTTACTDAD